MESWHRRESNAARFNSFRWIFVDKNGIRMMEYLVRYFEQQLIVRWFRVYNNEATVLLDIVVGRSE